MQIPWAALGRQQVHVEIDRLYVLAVPNYLQEAPPPEDAAAEEARLAEQKRKDVGSAEQRWVSKMQSMDESGSVASQPGYVQGVINVVLGNLKLKVSLHASFLAHMSTLIAARLHNACGSATSTCMLDIMI